MKKEVYISVDIEADGPIPGVYSMLSLGAAAFQAGNRVPIATFEINLERLPGAVQDPRTMQWWSEQKPEVWSHVTKDPVPPADGIPKFARWVRSLPGDPVLVTYPSWDYLWTHWYLVRYDGEKSPFGLGGLDIKSALFGSDPRYATFKGTAKRVIPPELFEGAPPHTHQALDDAIGQGVLFINFLAQRDARGTP